MSAPQDEFQALIYALQSMRSATYGICKANVPHICIVTYPFRSGRLCIPFLRYRVDYGS